MSALQAFWAAVVAHYSPGFTLNGNPYYSQLNYVRFGGSVGSEWYPYCTSSLLTLPGSYAYTESLWVNNYYLQMGNYLQSLGPPFNVIHSINAIATTPASTGYTYATQEAGYAVGWSNRFGVRDGFGSQGLSALDEYNCTTPNNCTTGSLYSASNWYPMFLQYYGYGVPLELQPESISYPNDTTCGQVSGPTCGTGNGNYSGDLPTFLYPFATSAGATDVEVYWRDLELAYDPSNYCDITGSTCVLSGSITPDDQLTGLPQQNQFFSSGTALGPGVGIGGLGTTCGGTQGSGNCNYRTNINNAHGQH
jgi:hypothetical protein